MSVSVTSTQKLKVVETVTTSDPVVGDGSFTHQQANEADVTLNATSTPKAEDVYSGQVQLSSGTATVDLTSLTNSTGGTAKDFTGKKVQVFKLHAASDNTAGVVVAPAVSNGYNLFGDSDGQVTLGANEYLSRFCNDQLAAVGASAKDLTLTSSDVDAKLNILLVAGT